MSIPGSGDHKAPSISSGVSHAVANGLGGFVYKPHTKRYSNSSIFLENRDILNDSVDLDLDSGPYLKHDYSGGGGGGGGVGCGGHHSNMLTPPDSDGASGTDKLEQYLGKDLRRYSDTKLLGSVDIEACDPMLESHQQQQYIDNAVSASTAIQHRSNPQPTLPPQPPQRMRQLIKQHSESAAAAGANTNMTHNKNTVLDMELPQSPLSPSVIQNLPQSNMMMRRSMHTVDEHSMVPTSNNSHQHHHHHHQQHRQQQHPHQQQQQQCQHIDKGRLFFKSLPNLSSSCESLIKK